jgi:cell wall assembly regulator SMI1
MKPLDLTNILRSMEFWYRAHAPRTAETLRPPTSPDAIAALEAELSLALHHDVRTLLTWHDGAKSSDEVSAFELLPSYQFLSIDNIRSEWVTQRNLAARIAGFIWNLAWIPIATDNCSRLLLIDHSTDPSHGHCFIWDPENYYWAHDNWRWPSVAAAVEATMEALEQGTSFLQYRPVLASGVLEWG